MKRPSLLGWVSCIAILSALGCLRRDDPLTYPFHDAGVGYYKDVAQEIAYPAVESETPEQIAFSQGPRTVLSRDLSEPWDMPLAEAVQLALQNNDVIRSAGQFLSPSNQMMANGTSAPSVYDPAINESGVLFGNRGIEGALAAFDTNFTTGMTWGRDSRIQNISSFGPVPGTPAERDTANFVAGLSKDFGYGGRFQLSHTVNYLGNNANVGPMGQIFRSTYSGSLAASYRQPLLAGAGTEFTGIAGPITQSFGGLSGVTQGVVIARINNDISIADFEANIRNLVKDAQDTYWDLYLAYRNFDTAVSARNAALAEWRRVKLILREGGVGAAPGVRAVEPRDESQARDQYFAAEAAVENTRSAIFTNETRLRRLLVLPVNEGRVIRPLDEPITAEFTPDWQVSLTEALMHRLELRKQKWQIKSLDLQLVAARSLTRPRFDFVGGYQVNAFGDNLLGYNDNDGVTTRGLDNYYETLTQGDQTGWSLGFEFNMPIGFRSAHSQVRNIELRLAKAQQVLFAQEMEIAHELAVAFQELARSYSSAQANYNRRKAAIDNVETTTIIVENGNGTADEILRAQERRAQAEVAFFVSMVDYNKALTNFQFRKGTLLDETNVTLLEDGWNPDAYVDAYRRAQARSAALDASFKYPAPEEFVSKTPLGSVYFAEPLPPTIPADGQDELQPLPAEDQPPTESAEPTPVEKGNPPQLPPVDPPLEPQALRQPLPLQNLEDGEPTVSSDERTSVPDETEETEMALDDRQISRATVSPVGEWRSID